MRWILVCALILVTAEQAWSKNWEIDQLMSIEAEADKTRDFVVKYLITPQKLWRSVKPKGAKDDSETVYSLFDSVRFYTCETSQGKKLCTVVTVNSFDPMMLWAHTYRMNMRVGKVGFRNANQDVKVLDHPANCFRTLIGAKIAGSAMNSYRVKNTSLSCYSPKIDVDQLAARMVKKMKTIKSYVEGENLVKYGKLTGLGIPLSQVATFSSRGVGPFGVGTTTIKISTTSVSEKPIDVSRLKLPAGYAVVDMSDQLKDVSFTPGK